MHSFLNFLSTVALIGLTTFLMSSVSLKEIELQQQLDKINMKYTNKLSELDTYSCKIDSLEEQISVINSPSYLQLRYGAEKFLTKRVQKQGRLPGTCVHVVPYIRNSEIHPHLHKALLGIAVPVYATSLKRGKVSFGNSKSKHRHGKAMDLALDKEGYEFLDWILTKEGVEWMEINKVTVYIESKRNSLKKNLPKELKQFFLRNSHATGNHIHIEIA